MATTNPPPAELPHPALPRVTAPPAFRDRRGVFRRDEDRTVHEERALLARALDILAGPGDADEHLAGHPGDGGPGRRGPAGGPCRRASRSGASRWRSRRASGRRPATRSRRGWTRTHPGPRRVAPRRRRPDQRGPRPARRAAARPRGDDAAGRDATSSSRCPGRAASISGWSWHPGPKRQQSTARLPPSTYRHVLVALALASARAADERERAALRARDAERTRFVSMVAHELRTPLTGLGGYLDLLWRGG